MNEEVVVDETKAKIIRNVLIVGALFVAVFIVILFVSFFSNSNGSISKNEMSSLELDLDIVENSVDIFEDSVLLGVSGDVVDDLEKLKFILDDGEDSEEVIVYPIDLYENGEEDFVLEISSVDLSMLESISIIPIVVEEGVERELDEYKITKDDAEWDDLFFEEASKLSTIVSIASCVDCGSDCDRTTCHLIKSGCYYEGGLSNICTSCSSLVCSDYNSERDCLTDRCEVNNCEWSSVSLTGNLLFDLGKSIFAKITGNVIGGSCVEIVEDTETTNAETNTPQDGSEDDVEEEEEVVLLDNGDACSIGADCTSGNCVDDVCCGSFSCPTCQSCDISGDGACAIDEGESCSDWGTCNSVGTCIEYAWERTGVEYVLQSGDWCSWGVNNFQCGSEYINNIGWTDQFIGDPYSSPTRYSSDVKCRPWVSNDAYVGTTIYEYRCVII